eukprot:c12187_g1_i2.p1 GENE.c12187_g1_i2~~c12187_g1_i2.p1  ORF type:complete len:512 (-),score=111.10 c12187_g1_i2:184-1719(-)
MDITRDVSSETWATLMDDLQTCDFVAMDGEMTGISIESETELLTDSPEVRYAKMKAVCQRYSLIQLGLCLFNYDEQKSRLVAKPYNFYLFPNSSRDITLSSSAVTFLRGNNMDFGKWIMDAEGEKKTRQRIWNESSGSKSHIPILKHQQDIDFVAKCVAEFQAFLVDSSRKTVELPPCNSYLLRALIPQLESQFTPLMTTQSRDAGNRALRLTVIRFADEAEKALWLDAQDQLKCEEFRRELGFREVFLKLVECSKPLVVHNGVFDLLFCLAGFDHLPDTLPEFRAVCKQRFRGGVFDTKMLATLALHPNIPMELPSTALGDLFDSVVQRVDSSSGLPVSRIKAEFAPGFDKYATSQAAHEAAYDAFMTGAIFGQIVDFHFATNNSPSSFSSLPPSIVKWNGHVMMFRSLFYLRLFHNDDRLTAEAKGDIVLWVEGVTQNDGKMDVRNASSWFFDNSSALVIVPQVENEHAAKKALGLSKDAHAILFREHVKLPQKKEQKKKRSADMDLSS